VPCCAASEAQQRHRHTCGQGAATDAWRSCRLPHTNRGCVCLQARCGCSERSRLQSLRKTSRGQLGHLRFADRSQDMTSVFTLGRDRHRHTGPQETATCRRGAKPQARKPLSLARLRRSPARVMPRTVAQPRGLPAAPSGGPPAWRSRRAARRVGAACAAAALPPLAASRQRRRPRHPQVCAAGALHGRPVLPDSE